MTYKEIKQLIGNKLNHDELAEVFRANIDDISALVNVLSLSQELLFCQNIVDFSVNGYRIIRVKDVTDIVTCEKNSSLKFINMIYKKEKLFPVENTMIDIKSWNTVADYFSAQNIPVTVECAYDDAADYYVGWIKSVSNNIAVMQCFDGSGILFKDEIKINLNFVSQITFADDYTRLMAKYV